MGSWHRSVLSAHVVERCRPDQRIEPAELGLEPHDPALVQPSSVDVRLDRYFRVFNNQKYTHIDPSRAARRADRPDRAERRRTVRAAPGEFVLASTLEVVTLPNDLAGRLEGKSSLGRLGLLTHSTAGFIDPGFSGHVTLELSNVANLPIMLWPGMKIGQLCIFRLSSPRSTLTVRRYSARDTRASAVRHQAGLGKTGEFGRLRLRPRPQARLRRPRSEFATDDRGQHIV